MVEYADFCRLVQKVQLLLYLWVYRTDLDHICTRCSYNMAIEYFKIRTAIFLLPISSERQHAE